MQLINEELLNSVSAEAAENLRFRKNYNLHASLDDKVQRLLNALEPGTELPVHRHRHTDETYLLLRGSLILKLYDDSKTLVDEYVLNPETGNYGASIPAGQWHTIEVLEKGTVIFEVKEGPYAPLSDEDIL